MIYPTFWLHLVLNKKGGDCLKKNIPGDSYSPIRLILSECLKFHAPKIELVLLSFPFTYCCSLDNYYYEMKLSLILQATIYCFILLLLRNINCLTLSITSIIIYAPEPSCKFFWTIVNIIALKDRKIWAIMRFNGCLQPSSITI